MQVDFPTLLKNITFTEIAPSDPARNTDIDFCGRTVPADVLNTVVRDPAWSPFPDALLRIPRMSSSSVAYLLNRAVGQLPAGCCFLNVGVWCGFTLLAGAWGNADKRCIGVDDFSEFGGPRERFLENLERFGAPGVELVEGRFQDYFASRQVPPLGVYLYDGAHDYDSQLEALEFAHPHLVRGGVVFVDDVNDGPPYDATLEFLRRHRGEYEVALHKVTAQNDHPTFWNGLLVLRRTDA